MSRRRFFSTTVQRNADTTADGKQVFLIIGDSNASGGGESVPTVASETLYKWNGSSIDEITTQEVTYNTTGGSIWQQMATDYKAEFGYKTVLINRGSGGAEFYPNAAQVGTGEENNNWYTSGDLYSPAVSEAQACLSFLGLTKLKAIIINLGINDLRAATSAFNIETGIDSLVTRLESDFPDVPKLVIQIGRSETTAWNDARYYRIRNYLIQKCQWNTNWHIVATALPFVTISGGYKADNLHYSQATNNTLGSQIVRWWKNSAYNKWARSVISAHYDDLSSLRKGLINDFITTQHTNGNYMKLECLHVFKTSHQNNIYFDWAFLGYAAPGANAPVFTANSDISTNGTNQSFVLSYTPSLYSRATLFNDVIMGCKTKTVTTAAGTVGTLFSRFDGTRGTRIVQLNTSSMQAHINDQTANGMAIADPSLVNNTLYSIARNGTSRSFIKNKTTFSTGTQSNDGAVAGSINIGVTNNNGSFNSYLNASYEYFFAARYSDFDLDSFYDGIEYLIAHWND